MLLPFTSASSAHHIVFVSLCDARFQITHDALNAPLHILRAMYELQMKRTDSFFLEVQKRWAAPSTQNTHSLAHSHTDSVTHRLTHAFTLSVPHSLTHSLTPSRSQCLTHSLTHSLTHAFTLSVPHSLTHPLTLCSHNTTHETTHHAVHTHMLTSPPPPLVLQVRRRRDQDGRDHPDAGPEVAAQQEAPLRADHQGRGHRHDRGVVRGERLLSQPASC